MAAKEFTELQWWQDIAGVGKTSAKVNTAKDYRAEEELISR